MNILVYILQPFSCILFKILESVIFDKNSVMQELQLFKFFRLIKLPIVFQAPSI